jgi:hypothetical protein
LKTVSFSWKPPLDESPDAASSHVAARGDTCHPLVWPEVGSGLRGTARRRVAGGGGRGCGGVHRTVAAAAAADDGDVTVGVPADGAAPLRGPPAVGAGAGGAAARAGLEQRQGGDGTV